MEIVDIFILPDGRSAYIISSDEVPDVHVGDVLEDCQENKSRITAVGNVTKCFGPKYTFSIMIDGKAERGKIRINEEN